MRTSCSRASWKRSRPGSSSARWRPGSPALIVTTTGTDVCFVHVLDDSGTALVLGGATQPFDAAVGRVRLLLGEGVTGWVASAAASR